MPTVDPVLIEVGGVEKNVTTIAGAGLLGSPQAARCIKTATPTDKKIRFEMFMILDLSFNIGTDTQKSSMRLPTKQARVAAADAAS
jgi:hypothetical protein